MKQTLLYPLALAAVVLFLGGCRKAVVDEGSGCGPVDSRKANYRSGQAANGVSVSIRSCSANEIRYYLKKRCKSVVPMRLTLDNKSGIDYRFSLSDTNIPLADQNKVIASLTPRAKRAYYIVAAGPLVAGGYFGAAGLYGLASVGLPVSYAGVVLASVVIPGVLIVSGILGSIIYAGVRHSKNKKVSARTAERLMQPMAVPAGKKVSTILFVDKDAVLPQDIAVSLRVHAPSEHVRPVTIR